MAKKKEKFSKFRPAKSEPTTLSPEDVCRGVIKNSLSVHGSESNIPLSDPYWDAQNKLRAIARGD